MTQEIMEAIECIDTEVHCLSARKMTELTESNLVEQLSYLDMLINKTFRLMLKERMNCDE